MAHFLLSFSFPL